MSKSKKTKLSASDYGHKAVAKVNGKQGRDFRKAKSKLKKGIYKGGTIDSLSSNSTKFKFSDSE